MKRVFSFLVEPICILMLNVVRWKEKVKAATVYIFCANKNALVFNGPSFFAYMTQNHISITYNYTTSSYSTLPVFVEIYLSEQY